MIDLLEKIITSITNFFDSVIAFFSNILTILGVIGDTFVLVFNLIVSVMSGTTLAVITSVLPVFVMPFLMFAIVKAVILLVT